MIILPEDKHLMERLSDLDAKMVLLALFSEDEDAPEMSPVADMAYASVKSKSDRLTKKKSRAGSLGGAPVGNQNAKKQAYGDIDNQNKQTEQKQPTVTDTVPVTSTSTSTSTVTSLDANASCPASQTSEPPSTALIVPEKAKTSAAAKARSDTINEIVTFLNLTLGTSYRPTAAKTRDKITARLNEGFTLDDFKTVICKKAAEWRNNPDMCGYLRPETLFGNKFEGYLNQPDAAPKQNARSVLEQLYHQAREDEACDSQ